MTSIQHTITALLLVVIVLGGADLLSGTMTQLEQFRRDFAESEQVSHGMASAWDEVSEVH